MNNVVAILVVILLLGLMGTLPVWPHAQAWGYGPSGGFGLLLLVVLVVILLLR